MAVVVYYTTVSSSKEIKAKQTKIFNWLDTKGIKYEKKDVSDSEKKFLKEMRENAVKCPDKEKALPPQIFMEGIHLGGYDEIETAVEDKNLDGFLNLDGDEGLCQQTQQTQQH